ncbi:hypothetical protein IJ670_05905 [bacterium]|nr:hypothetical protein [bacterium]
MIENIKAIGKFLDQPILISKLNKAVPLFLLTGGSIFMANDAMDEFKKNPDKNDAKKKVIEHGFVLLSAIASALLAPKIAGKITNHSPLPSIQKAQENAKNIVDNFLKKNNPKNDTLEILNKAKNKVLSLSEVKNLYKNCEDKEFLKKLIPDPDNIKAKDIFSEIGYLSIYGAVPVVGGVMGGIAADSLIKEDVKKKVPDKIKEGLYQYLANIFMCNIGAGVALSILEKLKITSKSARALAMGAGIAAFGIIGGSKIANFLSKKLLNPVLNIKNEEKERKPELLDIGLHTDDIATVSLLSGLKWIEPMLPTLYSVSGYRAGIGYRN